MLKTSIYPIAESTCTGLTRTKNSDFVLCLRYLQGQSLEAVLVLQRKEFYLSQTESWDSPFSRLYEDNYLMKEKELRHMMVVLSCLRQIFKIISSVQTFLTYIFQVTQVWLQEFLNDFCGLCAMGCDHLSPSCQQVSGCFSGCHTLWHSQELLTCCCWLFYLVFSFLWVKNWQAERREQSHYCFSWPQQATDPYYQLQQNDSGKELNILVQSTRMSFKISCVPAERST